ncbi:hypothetical protein BC829DRAFT_402135 [Chytridium lagenaria]|nr:hypothetical protein BC829DRAFT_402135 [Chytridium lagenaria]
MASNPKLGLPKEEPKEEEHPVIVAPPAASTTSTHTYLKAPKQKQPSHQSDSGSNAGVGPTDHHPPKPVDHEPSAFLQKFKRDMDEKRAAEAALVKARRAKRHSGAHPAGLTASARRRQQPTAPQNSVVAPAPDKNTNGPRNLPALNPTHNASDAEKGRKHAPSNQTKESVLLPSLTNPPKPTASNPSLHISEPSTLPSLKQGHGQPPAHTGLR